MPQMTREQAIKLLTSGPNGVKQWNRWRNYEQPTSDELPSLDAADLHGANLRYANLRYANFRDADLRYTNLRFANLRDANLHNADLRDANLREADLRNACFSHAHLYAAKLSYTRLDMAKLNNARCSVTVFADLDLSKAKGLDTITHVTSSTIGIDTLVRSKGRISEVFLRGCGVPEAMIQYLPSLIAGMSPVQFYSCFISYSHQDEAFCQRLHGRMQQKGLRVWYAPEDMKAGKKIHEQIDQAIRVHDKLLLVLSPHSMASQWVETEVYHARQREKRENRRVLFPIRLCTFDQVRDWTCFDADTGRDMAREVREYYIPDFSCWKDHDQFEAEFEKLIDALQDETLPPGALAEGRDSQAG